MSGLLQQGGLGVAEADYWEDPVPAFETKKKLLAGPRGLGLDAPAVARLADRRTLVYVAVESTTVGGQAERSLKSRGVLVTTRLEDRVTAASWAFESVRPDTPMPPPRKPSREDPPLLLTHTVDLRRAHQGALAWEAGTLRSWVLLFDAASNPVTTRVIGKEVHDPEVVKFLEARRKPTYAGPVRPAARDPLPSFARLPASPPPPERGVALAAPRVTLGAGPVVVHGSFRLPLLARERVAPPEPGDPAAERRPTAVVPLTLVVTGDTKSAPQVVNLGVPTWDPADAADAVVGGHFALDLREYADLRPYQTYAVWAVAAGELYGPALAATVDPAEVS